MLKDHQITPILQYLVHLDMADSSFLRLCRKLHLPHHQLTHLIAHIDQYHELPSIVYDHLKQAMQQMETQAVGLKAKGPTCVLPYGEHQLLVYLKKMLKFFQTRLRSLTLPLNPGHVYMRLHQFPVS